MTFGTGSLDTSGSGSGWRDTSDEKQLFSSPDICGNSLDLFPIFVRSKKDCSALGQHLLKSDNFLLRRPKTDKRQEKTRCVMCGACVHGVCVCVRHVRVVCVHGLAACACPSNLVCKPKCLENPTSKVSCD